MYLGMDVGTQGSRVIAIDDDGNILGTAASEHPLSTPQPGWTEQNPTDWWDSVRRACLALGGRLNLAEARGIGLTGQMHGAVFLDRQDRVIRPAPLWNDQRTAAQVEAMEQVAGRQLRDIALSPPITGFQAPKILWLRDNEPENFARLHTVLLPKDYIRFRLSGDRATDVADASGVLLLDVAGRDWSAELLDAFDIPRRWLPEVFEGPAATGTVSPAIARELGLPAGIPIAGGGGDNSAAAIGTGIIRPGVVSASIGTSGVVFAHAEQPVADPAGRIHTMCHSVPSAFHYMGVILSAGMCLRWLRDLLLDPIYDARPPTDIDAYELLTAAAAKAPPGSEGLVFLPYLAGERTPHIDPDARGALVGLTLRHGLAHVSRAVIEGITFALCDSMRLIADLGVSTTNVVATGGGARSPFWQQMLADAFDRPVQQVEAEEGPAFGAAVLGSVVGGGHSDVLSAVAACVRYRPPLEPQSDQVAIYKQYYQQYMELYGHLRDPNHSLSRLARQHV